MKINCNPHSLLSSVYLIGAGTRKQAVLCSPCTCLFFHGMELSVLTLKVAGPLYLFPPIICICFYLNLFLNFFIPYLKMLGTFLSPYFHKFNLLPHLSGYSFKIGLRPSGRIFYRVMHKFMF